MFLRSERHGFVTYLCMPCTSQLYQSEFSHAPVTLTTNKHGPFGPYSKVKLRFKLSPWWKSYCFDTFQNLRTTYLGCLSNRSTLKKKRDYRKGTRASILLKAMFVYCNVFEFSWNSNCFKSWKCGVYRNIILTGDLGTFIVYVYIYNKL